MLLNQEIITAVAEQIEALRINNLVVDPVMVSRTGAQLIDDAAVATFGTPSSLASVVTPNRYEAQILSGLEIHTLDDMRAPPSVFTTWCQSRVSQREEWRAIWCRCLV